MGRYTDPETKRSKAAIYGYAHQLLHKNLERELQAQREGALENGAIAQDAKKQDLNTQNSKTQDSKKQDSKKQDLKIRIRIILPEGKALARRTSNEAFGVVDGLSLLGTTGISQPLSAPQQLEHFKATLANRAKRYATVVFCLGENGLDIAKTLGIASDQLIKTANWLGPMLVAAAEAGVQSLLLLGYHGKLIKLAGGIFHTHHHLADGRQEILTAIAACQGIPEADLRHLLAIETIEAGLQYLYQLEQRDSRAWVSPIYGDITRRIEARSQAYIQSHCAHPLEVGCILFNRRREIFAVGPQGDKILPQILASHEDMP